MAQPQQDGRRRPNWVLRLLQKSHYTTGGVEAGLKSEAQLRRERWLLPGVPLLRFNRWALMPAAFLIHICIGSLYAWSVFNKPIDLLIYGRVRNLAPITFYIAVGALGTSAAVMGPWLERHGPMSAAVLGASLFCTGNLLTSLALYLRHMWLVYIGYGLVAGAGIGLCYISPVSALQKWFPERRGLAAGSAVCGFGAGAIVSARVQVELMAAVGLPATFLVLGLSYFAIMPGSALVLRTPPQTQTSQTQNIEYSTTPQTAHVSQISLLDALSSRTYRLMWLMFFSNILFGLVLLSRLSNMVTDIFGRSPEEASTIVAINGGFNLGGRLFMSALSDVIGRRNCYVAMLTVQLLILGTFSTIQGSGAYWVFLVTMWTLTACYGGGFGVIPAFLTDHFGPTNVGACHGLLLTAWSVAGVAGGLIFTAVFDSAQIGRPAHDPHAYNVNVWWMLGVVALGWLAGLCVQPTEKDKRFSARVKRVLCCAVMTVHVQEEKVENVDLQVEAEMKI